MTTVNRGEVSSSSNLTNAVPKEAKILVSEGLSPYGPLHIYMEDRRLKIRYTDPTKALPEFVRASADAEDYPIVIHNGITDSLYFVNDQTFDVSDDSLIDYTVSGNNIYIVNGTDQVLQTTITPTSEFSFSWTMNLHDIRVRDHWSVAFTLNGLDRLNFPFESERIPREAFGGIGPVTTRRDIIGGNLVVGPVENVNNGESSVDLFERARVVNSYIYLMRNAGWDKRSKAYGYVTDKDDCLLGNGAHLSSADKPQFPAPDESIGPYLGGNNNNEDKYKFFPKVWEEAQEFGLGRSTGNYIISPTNRGASRQHIRNNGIPTAFSPTGIPLWMYSLIPNDPQNNGSWWQQPELPESIMSSYYQAAPVTEEDLPVTYPPPRFNYDSTARGFTSVAAHGGRIWYGGAGGLIDEPEIGQSPDLEEYILFSRQDTVGQAGECHTAENPTQQDSAGVLPTDGGYIRVSGMLGFSHFESVGKSLLVVARNGIWVVTGPDGYFKADDFSIEKVTDLGCYNKNATAVVESSLCYMSPEGVVQLTFDGASFQPKIISDTIEAAIEKYESSARIFRGVGLESFAKVVFNREDYTLDVVVSGTVYFDPDGVSRTVGTSTNILRYSFKFQAWTEHKWPVPNTGPLVSLFYAPDVKKVIYNYQIPYSNAGVIYGIAEETDSPRDFDGGNAQNTIDAILISPMQTFGELGREKQVTYLTTFLEVDGGTTDRSLELDYAWDWGQLEKLNHIIEPDKCYAYGELYDRDEGLFFTPEGEGGSRPASLSPVIQPNKVKLSGSGKALQFRFQNTGGKYFKLYGYTVDVTGNGRV